ncbi:MAG: molybdopterin oxidoreductase, partial [Thermoleophilia bacterium]|nr:molybdopterin oxidoreductase [Thermoleophilia bacterium]
MAQGVSRRQLLGRALALGSGAALADLLGPARFLSPAGAATAGAVVPGNPLRVMPDRTWEQIYRNQFEDDSTFVFTCAPNDTHNCLLRAHVKNGVVVRISPTYGYGEATDLYGNRASHRWDPRTCQKGLILSRRFYSERRVKAPMIRKGFKDWVEAGYPRNDDGTPQMD